MLLNLAL
jgi:chromosome segregation ATPase